MTEDRSLAIEVGHPLVVEQDHLFIIEGNLPLAMATDCPFAIESILVPRPIFDNIQPTFIVFTAVCITTTTADTDHCYIADTTTVGCMTKHLIPAQTLEKIPIMESLI